LTQPELTDIDLAALAPESAMSKALCDALIQDGMALLSLPAGSAETFQRCQQAMAKFFAQPEAEKQRHAGTTGAGCQVGFMHTDRPGVEIFEAKCRHDPRYPWPETGGVKAAVLGARELLHRAALTCLRAIAAEALAEVDFEEGIARLLDAADTPLQSASNTTMRVWRYPPGGAGSELHCDNSLLTLAPKGSRVGLGARRRRDGVRLLPEEHMGPNQVLVFAGDALSFLTAGRIPALVHWVIPTDAYDPAGRLSMPFFLRPRLSALLTPTPAARDACPGVAPICQREIDGGGRTCHLEGCSEDGAKLCGACGKVGYCSVDHQALDWKRRHARECGPAARLSARWPWKADPYYHAEKGELYGRGVVSQEA